LPIDGSSFSGGDVLVYIGVNDGERSLCSSSVMYQPEHSSSLTITNAAQVGNIILFNIDNNLSQTVNGTLLITGKNNYDNQAAQSISMEGLGSQPMQLDITALGEEDAYTIRVLGEDSSVISNIVTVVRNGSVQLESPYAIPASGTYSDSFLVTLQSPDPLAKIFYTLNGEDPNQENAAEYTEAFTVDSSIILKAIAVREGYADSDAAVYQYVIGVGVTGVSLDKSALELTVGEAGQTLTATVMPENAANRNVTWTSSNEAVARVQNGVVTPVSAGTAIINVITDDGNYSVSATVTVKAASNNSGGFMFMAPQLPKIKDSNIEGWQAIEKELKIRDKDVSIEMKDSTLVPKEVFEAIQGRDIRVTFILKNNYEWIIDGKDLFKDPETPVITDADLSIKTDNNIPAQLIETLTGIGNIRYSLTGQNNYDWTLRVPIPKELDGKFAKLFLYNKQENRLDFVGLAVNIDDGYAIFKTEGAGDYVIEINNKVSVDQELQQITVTPLKKTLYIGGTTGKNTTLKVTIPELINALEKEGLCKVSVNFKSSNPKVAAVSRTGKIAANGKGKAVITTTVKVDGVELSFTTTITVKKAYIKLTRITDKMSVGDSFTFKAVGYGVNTKNITFTTTAKSVITISKTTGKATAKTKGTDYVVAKSGKIAVKVKVVVS
jgi:uncharacterized protein YjdB